MTIMSYGKIAFAGRTIAIKGWMLLIVTPLMFSALFLFIDRNISGLLLFIGMGMLCAFVYAFLNGRDSDNDEWGQNSRCKF